MALGSGKWCRYHCHLLRDMLWCKANGLFDSAVHYAQLAANIYAMGQLMVRGGCASRPAAVLQEWFAWQAA